MDKALKDLYKSADPERKLTILRMEMVSPISTIRGYSALIQKNFEANITQPDEFKEWIVKISRAANHLQELLDELN